jgi:AraC family transcriptional activator of pobA
MDIWSNVQDKTNIRSWRAEMALLVPTYDLYGENRTKRPDFWLHCETIASRSSAYHWEIGLHRHESFQQFLYIRNGSGDATFAGETMALAPPCIVSVPPGVSHGFRFSRDIDGMVITLLAERLRLTSGLARRPDDWLSSPRLIRLAAGADADYLDQTLQRLSDEFASQRSGGIGLIEAYLKAAVLLLGRQVGNGGRELVRDARLMRIDALNDLIGRHFRRQWTVADYARKLNLSPTHLNRLVREAAGMTVHDLIMARVIEEGRRALVFTPASIQSIADQLGFADAAYFARCFRRRTGITPRQYREEERGRLQEMQVGEKAALTAKPPL